MFRSLLLSAVLLLPATARAFVANNIENLLLPQAFPVDELHPGRWSVKLAPAYLKFSNDDGGQNVDANELNDLSGGGAAVGIEYALSRRSALSFEGLYYSLS